MSLFDLKTDGSQLDPMNEGSAATLYEQVAPTREIAGDNFPKGQIIFRFSGDAAKWWEPKRSFLKFRVTISDDNDAALNAGTISANMGLAGNMFQSMEFRINGTVVSRISDNVAQVDALRTRLHKSKAWIDGIGASTNKWAYSVASRGSGYTKLEFCWVPPLSIFQSIKHALPGIRQL